MERPFIVHVNLSSILKDNKETHYTMYIDYTKMTIVHELVAWIQWIFSLTHCVYLTHENSVIHELEDIKILSALKKVEVQNCDHSPCVHTKLNQLLKKLNFFVQWDGIEVPYMFLNKVNEITQKLVHKKSGAEVMMNDCSEEETASFGEVENIESNKIKELGSGNINTCENQLSENLNSNTCETNKTNFNIKSYIKLGDAEVNVDNTNKKLGDAVAKVDDSNNVHSVLSVENEFVNAPVEISKAEIEQIKALKDIIPPAADFNMNSDVKLYDTAVQTSSSNKVNSVLSNKSVHVDSINIANIIDSDTKLYDTPVSYSAGQPISTAGINKSNKIHSVLYDENEFANASIKISKAEIEKIKALKDIKISENTECNKYDEINKSNRKRLQSDDKWFNDNKIIKKGFKPFSVGEILTSLRSEFNTSYNNHECNTFPIQPNQNYSNGLTNDRLEGSNQNLSSYFDSKIKRKRIRRHRPRRLCSGGFKLDNFSHLTKYEGEVIPGTVNFYAPYSTKRSTHIRFPSDDENYSTTKHPESDKQPEKNQHDLSNSNELVENGMQQFSLTNRKEETLSMTQPNDCNKNDDSKVDDSSEANKEYSTLDKLILLHDQKSSPDSLFEYSNEDNQETICVPKTPDNFDFNLSALKALKEKFPSPMVVERFY